LLIFLVEVEPAEILFQSVGNAFLESQIPASVLHGLVASSNIRLGLTAVSWRLGWGFAKGLERASCLLEYRAVIFLRLLLNYRL